MWSLDEVIGVIKLEVLEFESDCVSLLGVCRFRKLVHNGFVKILENDLSERCVFLL